MPSNESQVLKSIVEYLTMTGWPVFRMNVGTWQDSRTGSWVRGQDVGTPDLCVGYKCYGYILLAWIEVKDKARVSDAQISKLRGIHKQGMPWLVAHSVDDVIRWQKDMSYHGSERDVADILDETRKFVPVEMKRKKAKLDIGTMLEFEMFSRKRELSTPKPIDKP